jgi:ABC-2 type transport system permease protein
VAVSAIFFGIWQTWTAVAITLAERDTLDLGRFLVYPLPPGRIYAYGLVASAAGDPFALFWSVMLGGAFAGAAIGRPGGWLALFAITIVLFVFATVAYVALIQELLGRLVRIRRARELAIAAAYLGMVAILAWLSTGTKRPLREILGHLSRVQWLAWPAALAATASRRLFTGHVWDALAPLAALAAAAVATGWSAFRLALADALSGSEGLSGRAAASDRGGGLPVAWFGRTRGALLEKEWQYLLRHPLSLVMALVIPAIAGLVAWRVAPREAGAILAALPLFGFALYAHVVTQPFWLNGFGWDRGGARLLFLAPIGLEDVLAAKNLATFTLSAVIFGGCILAIVAVAGFPPGWVIAGGITLHAGLAPWLYAAGNAVTSSNPIGAGFSLERGSRLPMLSGLIGMGITSVVTGVFAIPVLLALKLDVGWLLPPSWLALGVAGLLVHRATLPASGRLAERRREVILDAVCAEDE